MEIEDDGVQDGHQTGGYLLELRGPCKWPSKWGFHCVDECFLCFKTCLFVEYYE